MGQPTAQSAVHRRRGVLVLLTLSLLIGGVIGWQGRKRWRETRSDRSTVIAPTPHAETTPSGRRLQTVSAVVLPKQTPVETGTPGVDAEGIPYLEIAGIGRVRHPYFMALYALGYAGRETYTNDGFVRPDREKFRLTVAALADHLKPTKSGDWAWHYLFDSSYNDVSIAQPWYSGFGQAVGIEALVASYEIDGNRDHLNAAERAADVLFRPIADGGVLFSRGDDVFFEEIPNNAANPSHILNGHMRTLIALGHLHRATGRQKYADWRDRGLGTLQRWLPYYDTGYWFRYDLNLKKRELLIRLVHKSGPNGRTIAIRRVTVVDPQTGEEIRLDVAAPGAADGPVRIAGLGWSAVQTVKGRAARFLAASSAASGSVPRDAYFYLALPGDSKATLRTEPYLLEIEYWDAGRDRLTVETRSIAPGTEFRPISEDATQLTWGEQTWKTARFSLSPRHCGWWVGNHYGRLHALYLSELAMVRPSLKPYADKARDYYQAAQSPVSSPRVPMPTAHRPRPAVAVKPKTTGENR